MIDANLWQAAQLVGDISGTSDPPEGRIRTDSSPGEGPKTLGTGLLRRSRLGESNPRPTHYEQPGTPLQARYPH
jgi:hypothetical protein